MEFKRQKTDRRGLPGSQTLYVKFPLLSNSRKSLINDDLNGKKSILTSPVQPAFKLTRQKDLDYTLRKNRSKPSENGVGLTGLETAYREFVGYIECILQGRHSDAPDLANEEIRQRTLANPICNLDFSYDVRNSDLLFYCHLAFSIQFLRTNACKYFASFDSPEEIEEFRKSTTSILIKLYDKAIALMQKFIVNPDFFDLRTFVISLTVLHMVQFHQNLGLTFQNGLFSIFKEVTEKDLTILNDELAGVLDVFEFALKTPVIPGYDPTFLKEVEGKLLEFGKILKYFHHRYPKKYRTLVFSYNLLMEYFEYFRLKVGTKDILEIGKLLRRWYVICPPFAEVSEHLKDPLEKVFGLICRMICIILINLFPLLMYYYLLSFNGSIFLYLEYPWIRSFDDFLDTETSSEEEKDYLKSLRGIGEYSHFLTAFFSSRYRCFTFYYGYQRRKYQVFPNKIKRVLNEMMVQSFENARIIPINYPHIAWIAIQQSGALLEKKDLFYYNQDHLKYSLPSQSLSGCVLRYQMGSSKVSSLLNDLDELIDYRMWHESKIIPAVERCMIKSYQAISANHYNNLTRDPKKNRLANGFYHEDANFGWYFHQSEYDSKRFSSSEILNRLKYLLWYQARRNELESPESDWLFYDDVNENLYKVR